MPVLLFWCRIGEHDMNDTQDTFELVWRIDGNEAVLKMRQFVHKSDAIEFVNLLWSLLEKTQEIEVEQKESEAS